MSYDLNGKVVFVTGASSGIGAAAARAYAAAGAKVVLAARRQDRVERLARELEQSGRSALAVPCDVRSDGEVRTAIHAAVLRFGGLDVLVNNAGVGLIGPVEELTPEALHENFDTNVYGVLRCVRAALPQLRTRGGGQIVNVSSILAYRSLPHLGGYCASKFALNALTEAMRVELAEEGIDVILIAPGGTESEFRESEVATAPAHRRGKARLTMSAEAVAEAMVKASRKRTREVILTASGRAMIRAARLAPSLFDRVAGLRARK